MRGWIATTGMMALATAGVVAPACIDENPAVDGGWSHSVLSSSDAGPGDAGPDGSPDACEPITCDDVGQMCGELDDGCGNTLDCGPCECGLDLTPSLDMGVTVDFDKTVKLPIVGWKVGGEGDVSLSGELDGASCSNDCKSHFNIAGSGTLKVALKDALSVGLDGSYTADSEYCMECNDSTCEKECTELSCEKQSLDITGNAEYEKYIGMKKLTLIPGSGNWVPRVAFECGVTGTVHAQGGIDGSWDTPGSCDPCPDCKRWGGHGGGGLGAKVNCRIDLTFLEKTRTFGCKGCASIKGDVDVGVSKKWGACGDEWCFKITGKAGITAYAQKCVGWGWFKAFISCGGKASGKVWYDSCAPPGADWYGGDIGGWCKVSKACPSKCVCCDGSVSPGCKPKEDGSPVHGNCCRGHGGVCDGRCL